MTTLREWLSKVEPESVTDFMRAVVEEYESKGPFTVDDSGPDAYYVTAPAWGRIASDLEETEARLIAALLNWNNDQRGDWLDGEPDDRDPEESE